MEIFMALFFYGWTLFLGGTYVLLPMDAMMDHNFALLDEYHFLFHECTRQDSD